MANTWASNGADTGGSGGYVPGTQSVGFILTNFAANGDTITMPSGTFTWTSGITVNLAVRITGSGYTPNTAINCSSPGAPTLATSVTWTQSATAVTLNSTSVGGGNYFRLSGIAFTGSVAASSFQGTYFVNSGSATTDPFRIDNCSFTGTGQVVMFIIGGNPVGCVLDHNTFIGGAASEMVHNVAVGASSLTGWNDDLTPGSNQLLYFEDNIFQLNGYATATGQQGTSGFQTYYGARTGVRYNLSNFCQFDAHGSNTPNTRWIECYKNQLFIPSTNTGFTQLMVIRGGSGVVWGNTFAAGSTQTSGLQTITLYTDQGKPAGGTAGPSGSTLSPAISGPAPEYGPGAGIFSSSSTSQGPTSSPVYLWANDSNYTVGSGTVGNGGWSPSPIALNSNYFVSTTQPSSMTISQKASQVGGTTYSYSPYTYPHPLTGLSNTPGSGLTQASDVSMAKTVLGIAGGYPTPANTYMACYTNAFTNSPKSGASEWTTSPNTAYARVAMGASGAGWSVAAYANGVGVLFSNANGVATAAVVGATQSLFSLAWCDSATIGAGNTLFFCDVVGGVSIGVGQCVALAIGGVVFTTY